MSHSTFTFNAPAPAPAPTFNYCMHNNSSCSSCCGLHNLKMTKSEKETWLVQNTNRFLQTDISQAKNIVEFRELGEDILSDYIINPDTYVCPFMGYVKNNPNRSGCMLHPLGDLHKQVKLWQHPQNFSFYGESICQAFDCYSKENNLLKDTKTFSLDSVTYSQIVANQNLLRIINLLCEKERIKQENIFTAVIHFLKQNQSTITGFEEFINWEKQNLNLWHALGTILSQEEVEYNPFLITETGIKNGDFLKNKIIS